jgi:Mlc titration factor MtfA (ptsG expression regulator)
VVVRTVALLGLVLLLALAAAALVRWRRRRRAAALRRLQRSPFSPEWRSVLRRNVPLYRRLSDAERARLEGHVQVFLAEKRFEGCGGLELTDEIRVTIAAQACLLLLGHDAGGYPELRSILVYPSTVVPEYVEPEVDGDLVHEPEPLVGESWAHGTVILAWDDVLDGAATADDGWNVVLHEFAHQLDQETGDADGTPHLDTLAATKRWRRVMREHLAALRQAADQGRPTLLDPYGAEDPAEFFAVATECFFEQPLELKLEHPELYRELSAFYRLDPVSWHAPG